MLISSMAFAQQTPNPQQDLEKYERQWKNNRKTARIIALTGGVIATTGFIIGVTDKYKNEGLISQQGLIAMFTACSGAVVTLSAMPFAVIASKKKEKYIKLKSVVSSESIGNQQYTTVGLSINF